MMINTIFDFEHFLVYLAGPIQYAKDGGVSWRDNVTGQMIDIGIKENHILNPCKKPLNNFEGDDLDAAFKQINTLHKNGDWEEIEKLSRNTIRIDLRLIDKSDLIYTHVDPNVYSFGTPDEIGMARTQRKPVIAVVNGGIQKAPYWLIGRIGRQNIFASDNDAISYMKDIMHGKVPFDPKSWLFFDMGEKHDTQKD